MKSFNDYLKEAALSAKQKKIAAVAGDKDKIDSADLAALRAGKKPVEEASCSSKDMKKEELVGNQHKLDKNKNGKLDAHDFKLLRKEEAEELDEGRVKELAMDLKDMSHDEFHKQYGKPKSHYDPTNFKKPVEPGKGMDRAKALAQRGMQSLSKEEVERIEEKLTQLDELKASTLQSYKDKAQDEIKDRKDSLKYYDADAFKYDGGKKGWKEKITKREKGINLATSKLAKEEVEQIDELSKKTLGSYAHKAIDHAYDKAFDDDEVKSTRTKGIERASKKMGDKNISKDSKGMVRAFSGQHKAMYRGDETTRFNRSVDADDRFRQAHDKITKASGVKPEWQKEEVEQEMSPYLKATLKVMDEGKIDNLRDAQKLRRDTQSAYEKDYKPDTSHPHIQVVKGTAYGGENQKDDEGDEKPEAEKEKRGRGRPSGSKSGARLKGGGHEDGGIPVHNLNLPKSYK